MTPEQEARIVLDYDVEFSDALLFGVKRCSVCGRERPNCGTYFPTDMTKPGGLKAGCRECHTASQRQGQPRPEQVDASLVFALVRSLRKRGLTIEQIASGAGVAKSACVDKTPTKSAVTLRKLLDYSDSLKRTRRGQS